MAAMLSEAISKARAKKGISLRELARLTDVQHSHLSELETGKRPNPRWLTLARVARALNMKLDPLLR